MPVTEVAAEAAKKIAKKKAEETAKKQVSGNSDDDGGGLLQIVATCGIVAAIFVILTVMAAALFAVAVLMAVVLYVVMCYKLISDFINWITGNDVDDESMDEADLGLDDYYPDDQFAAIADAFNSRVQGSYAKMIEVWNKCCDELEQGDLSAFSDLIGDNGILLDDTTVYDSVLEDYDYDCNLWSKALTNYNNEHPGVSYTNDSSDVPIGGGFTWITSGKNAVTSSSDWNENYATKYPSGLTYNGKYLTGEEPTFDSEISKQALDDQTNEGQIQDMCYLVAAYNSSLGELPLQNKSDDATFAGMYNSYVFDINYKLSTSMGDSLWSEIKNSVLPAMSGAYNYIKSAVKNEFLGPIYKALFGEDLPDEAKLDFFQFSADLQGINKYKRTVKVYIRSSEEAAASLDAANFDPQDANEEITSDYSSEITGNKGFIWLDVPTNVSLTFTRIITNNGNEETITDTPCTSTEVESGISVETKINGFANSVMQKRGQTTVENSDDVSSMTREDIEDDIRDIYNWHFDSVAIANSKVTYPVSNALSFIIKMSASTNYSGSNGAQPDFNIYDAKVSRILKIENGTNSSTQLSTPSDGIKSVEDSSIYFATKEIKVVTTRVITTVQTETTYNNESSQVESTSTTTTTTTSTVRDNTLPYTMLILHTGDDGEYTEWGWYEKGNATSAYSGNSIGDGYRLYNILQTQNSIKDKYDSWCENKDESTEETEGGSEVVVSEFRQTNIGSESTTVTTYKVSYVDTTVTTETNTGGYTIDIGNSEKSVETVETKSFDTTKQISVNRNYTMFYLRATAGAVNVDGIITFLMFGSKYYDEIDGVTSAIFSDETNYIAYADYIDENGAQVTDDGDYVFKLYMDELEAEAAQYDATVRGLTTTAIFIDSEGESFTPEGGVQWEHLTKIWTDANGAKLLPACAPITRYKYTCGCYGTADTCIGEANDEYFKQGQDTDDSHGNTGCGAAKATSSFDDVDAMEIDDGDTGTALGSDTAGQSYDNTTSSRGNKAYMQTTYDSVGNANGIEYVTLEDKIAMDTEEFIEDIEGAMEASLSTTISGDYAGIIANLVNNPGDYGLESSYVNTIGTYDTDDSTLLWSEAASLIEQYYLKLGLYDYVGADSGDLSTFRIGRLKVCGEAAYDLVSMIALLSEGNKTEAFKAALEGGYFENEEVIDEWNTKEESLLKQIWEEYAPDLDQNDPFFLSDVSYWTGDKILSTRDLDGDDENDVIVSEYSEMSAALAALLYSTYGTQAQDMYYVLAVKDTLDGIYTYVELGEDKWDCENTCSGGQIQETAYIFLAALALDYELQEDDPHLVGEVNASEFYNGNCDSDVNSLGYNLIHYETSNYEHADFASAQQHANMLHMRYQLLTGATASNDPTRDLLDAACDDYSEDHVSNRDNSVN